MEKEQLQLEEYKECSVFLRYYGNQLFAQLGVFLTGNAALIASIWGEHSIFPDNSWLRMAGLLFTILFNQMNYRRTLLWNSAWDRTRELESKLSFTLHTNRPGERLDGWQGKGLKAFDRWLWNRNQITLVYVGFMVFWLFMLVIKLVDGRF